MASGDAVERVEVNETSFSLKTSRENAEIKEGESDDDDKGRSSALDKTQTDMSIGSGPTSGGAGVPRTPGAMRATDKERKIGHRRVGVGGEITYKKIQSSQIMGSIQLGIQHAVGGLASKPERDVLMNDFMSVETTNFPSEGSNHTPAHHFSEFRFKNYAPIAFRYFRDLFGIQPDDFLMSMCSAPLRELSNPGASGSIFYLTDDDEFIIKTVQHKEGEFLQKLLPGYFMNLNQNPRTLLPKFFGLYCYQCNSKNIRLVAMNNLLPSFIRLHQKYDLKGSTYKRKASKSERNKSSPTFKDLDFMEHHPEGLFLEADTYNALVRTIQRDCLVLKSFEIMDYSLLVAIHNLDQAQKDKLNRQSQLNLAADSGESAPNTPLPLTDGEAPPSLSFVQTERAVEKQDRIAANNLIRERGEGPSSSTAVNRNRPADRQRLTTMESIQAESERGEGSAPGGTASVVLNRSRSINRQRLVAHSTAMESIQAESEPIDEEEDVPPGGIPARSAKGERLLLFIGIIDILQSYRLKKKLEHTWKSLIHDGDTVSVHRPKFYAHRFQEFMSKTVFKKIPSPLKHSPSKRKSLSRPLRQELDYESGPSTSAALQTIESKTVLNHTEGSRAGLAPSPSCSTPLPAFDDVIRQPTDSASGSMSVRSAGSSSGRSGSSGSSAAARHRVAQSVSKSSTYREETVSISDIRLESRCENKSSLSVESGSSGRGGTRGAWTPPHSVEGSTPTWTEGTPSFTESSSSGDIVSATTTHAPMPMSDCSVAAKQAAEVEHIAMCLASEMVSATRTTVVKTASSLVQ